MTHKEQSIDSILKERRQRIHEELLSNPQYAQLIKIDALIKYSQDSFDSQTAEKPVVKYEPEVKPVKSKKKKLVKKSKSQTTVFVDANVVDKIFPTEGRRKRGRQLKFLVNEAGRAITKNEIQKRLEEKTGETANIREALKRAVNLGDLVYVKFNNSQRYAFIALPIWIERDNAGKYLLKREYFPEITELPMNYNYKKQEVEGMKEKQVRLL